MNNFMSHYFLYRALTHNDRNGVAYGYAPVYGGARSIVYDIVTFIILILVIVFAVIMYKRWKRKRNRLY